MSKVKLPTNLITKRFAMDGARVDPDTTIGPKKYDEGWLKEIPQPENENFIQGRQDDAIANIVQNGIADWEKTVNYEKNGLVSYGKGTYISLTAENTNHEPPKIGKDAWWAPQDMPTANSYDQAIVQTFADSNLRNPIIDPIGPVCDKRLSHVPSDLSVPERQAVAAKIGEDTVSPGTLVASNVDGRLSSSNVQVNSVPAFLTGGQDGSNVQNTYSADNVNKLLGTAGKLAKKADVDLGNIDYLSVNQKQEVGKKIGGNTRVPSSIAVSNEDGRLSSANTVIDEVPAYLHGGMDSSDVLNTFSHKNVAKFLKDDFMDRGALNIAVTGIDLTSPTHLDSFTSGLVYYVAASDPSFTPFGWKGGFKLEIFAYEHDSVVEQKLTGLNLTWDNTRGYTLTRTLVGKGATWTQWWGHKLNYNFPDIYPYPYIPGSAPSSLSSGIYINPKHPQSESGNSRVKDGEPILDLEINYEETGHNTLHIWGRLTLSIPAEWSLEKVPSDGPTISAIGVWLPFRDYNIDANKLITATPSVNLEVVVGTDKVSTDTIPSYYLYNNVYNTRNGRIAVIDDKDGRPINCIWLGAQSIGSSGTGTSLDFNIQVYGLEKRP